MRLKRFSYFTAITLASVMTMSASLSVQAGPRLDRIMEEKTLRVGTPGDYRPFAIKTEAGAYEGHDIDVINNIAEQMGVEIEFVPTTWPNLMGDLLDDKFDVAVGGITRTIPRLSKAEMLPGYAAFGKVALARKEEAEKYKQPNDLNQSAVRVIKNPGGTNEEYVLQYLTDAKVSTHDKNAEIPALIADGKGDIMITETYEALYYSKADPRLTALFIDEPLTPKSYLGFMLPADDADYVRVMQYTWDLANQRNALSEAEKKWLK